MQKKCTNEQEKVNSNNMQQKKWNANASSKLKGNHTKAKKNFLTKKKTQRKLIRRVKTKLNAIPGNGAKNLLNRRFCYWLTNRRIQYCNKIPQVHGVNL